MRYAICDKLVPAKCEKVIGKESAEYEGLHADLGGVSRLYGSHQVTLAER